MADGTYTDDYALSLDVGGHDHYLNNAGGSNLGGGNCYIRAEAGRAAAALVDLAGGDRYGRSPWWSSRNCGTNGGGGNVGVGFLLDAGGDDSYTAGSYGTNGGGLAGVGFLLDAGGDDSFRAASYGTNGGGNAVGVGFLLDAGGDDAYAADSYGTNGGAALGVGFLLDADGDDAYAAGSIAANGGGYLGVGILLDGGGHDVYQDNDGGTGRDRTVVPKRSGAQVDAHGPSEASSESVSQPALGTPSTPPVPVDAPPLDAPAACTLPPCRDATVDPGRTVEEAIDAPFARGADTPPIARTCDPTGSVACLGAIPSRHLADPPPGGRPGIGLPAVVAPGVCSLAPEACLPSTTLVPATHVADVAGRPSIPLTPPIRVSIGSSGVGASAEPRAGELTPFGPQPLGLPPVEIELCPQTCPAPAQPHASAREMVTVTAEAGSTSRTVVVPVDARA